MKPPLKNSIHFPSTREVESVKSNVQGQLGMVTTIRRQRQRKLCKFKVSLIHIANYRMARTTKERNPVNK